MKSDERERYLMIDRSTVVKQKSYENGYVSFLLEHLQTVGI